MEGQVTIGFRDDLAIEWPIARTVDAWLTFGFDEDLRQAARIALDGMLNLMGREHDLNRDDALALAGVHAVLRDDAWSSA